MLNIEYYTPQGRNFSRWVSEIRKVIVLLSNEYPYISRAEVVLKEEDAVIPKENKVCEIRLVIYGSDMSIYTRTSSFGKSVRQALEELQKLVAREIATMHDLPDVVVSTVKV
jgi:putative sigma-54 modulation protein